MAKALRKYLPKDFEKLLRTEPVEKLKAIFDQCDVDATERHYQSTAIAYPACPDELAEWLVNDRGASLVASDRLGNTPLHQRAAAWQGQVGILLKLGADPNHRSEGYGMPLHAAISSANVAAVHLLLAAGARPDERNNDDMTPLEKGLYQCAGGQIVEMYEIARALVEAKATITPRVSSFVTELGKRFEFYRTGETTELFEATNAALNGLYALFGAEKAEQRQMHDGKAAILVSSGSWQGQFQNLWDYLVPSSGPAPTVQGEVIRIAGRIARELKDNGGTNWGPEFKKCADAFASYVQEGLPLPSNALADLIPAIEALKFKRGDSDFLAQAALAWIERNPAPIKLPAVAYQL